MATATAIADGNVPHTTRPQDVSSDALSDSTENGITGKSNGYISSPLRTSQRVGNLDKDLPDVPNHEPGQSRPNSAHFGEASFPFDAQPGAAGLVPTTNGAVDGYGKDDLAIHELTPKRTNVSGTSTPPGRRSVQFAREAGGSDPMPLAKTTTWEADEGVDQPPSGKERQGSLLGKLKAFASSTPPAHARTTSAVTASRSPSTAMSPQSERSEPTYPVEEVEDAEADVEEDSEDVATDLEAPRKPRRKSQRPRMLGTESSPSTPKMSRLEHRFASFMREHAGADDLKASPPRPAGMKRSKTSDSGDPGRAGLSEDEGRDRIRNAWRKGIEGARGLSYHPRNKTDDDSPGATRPSQFRRITGLADASSSSPLRTREKPDRQTTTSAQKWRQVKAGLKLLGQRKRDERIRVDHQKSAQLMAELLAGSPAALVLASMFQRDESNHKKIPVLLEQLKIRISDSFIRREKDGDRHFTFKIDLEYGNGAARMQWTIWRTLKDFVNMHARYQASAAADKVRHLGSEHRAKAKMPRFPRSAFPYARGIRGLFDNLQEEDEEDDEILPPTPGFAMLGGVADSPTTPGPTATPLVPGGALMPETPGVDGGHKRRKSSIFTPPGLRRSSTAEIGPLPNDPNQLTERQMELYQRRQRRKLETYLQQMIRWLIFRPDSTRLCRFLEISALAIRLSAEGGFQGKQGLLTIASAQNKEVRRRRFNPAEIRDRHHSRWFLVRHSYIVCVDGPESVNP